MSRLESYGLIIYTISCKSYDVSPQLLTQLKWAKETDC